MLHMNHQLTMTNINIIASITYDKTKTETRSNEEIKETIHKKLVKIIQEGLFELYLEQTIAVYKLDISYLP